ncbi:hypothetical protein NDU88_001739 [Pleurodeles waltl]|uniref:Uncharacterized protein n=1 Tax=Pleurodeles waltl TaxID=8319 RepID=A0AAV7LC78_PLEWA|nr:hypothetical protein NDU88_001739 [Pleurodeles waltl]
MLVMHRYILGNDLGYLRFQLFSKPPVAGVEPLQAAECGTQEQRGAERARGIASYMPSGALDCWEAIWGLPDPIRSSPEPETRQLRLAEQKVQNGEELLLLPHPEPVGHLGIQACCLEKPSKSVVPATGYCKWIKAVGQ